MEAEGTRRLQPQLRFPEFRDAGDWNEKRLGELLLSHPDYGINAPAVPYSADLPTYLRITDISDEGYYLFEKKVSVAIEATDENYLSEGDIVLARTGASVGKSYKYRKEDGKLVFAGFLIRIKPDPKRIDAVFLFNFIATEQYWNWVSVTSARSGQPGINGNEYATLSIPIPPYGSDGNGLSEQQKIADCLASVDGLLTAVTQKIDSLKAHKKGLLQQLFPAAGETTPQRRFPEFQDAGEWEEKRLEQISDIKTGPFGSTLHESDYVETGTPIITVEHLDELGIKGNNLPRVSDADKSRLSSYHLKEGDIVFSRVGSVDRCSMISANEDGWLFSGRLLRLRITKPERNSPQFLNQLLKHEPNKTKIRNMAVGQTMPSLNTEILKSISLHLPTFEEQQKIADCLASLDELIAAYSQKLDALKAHKKGLLQQLFPQPTEATTP